MVMEKALEYFRNEHHYDDVDLIQMWGSEYSEFMEGLKEKGLDNPLDVETERLMHKAIDDFMIDMQMDNRRRRRAY